MGSNSFRLTLRYPWGTTYLTTCNFLNFKPTYRWTLSSSATFESRNTIRTLNGKKQKITVVKQNGLTTRFKHWALDPSCVFFSFSLHEGLGILLDLVVQESRHLPSALALQVRLSLQAAHRDPISIV